MADAAVTRHGSADDEPDAVPPWPAPLRPRATTVKPSASTWAAAPGPGPQVLPAAAAAAACPAPGLPSPSDTTVLAATVGTAARNEAVTPVPWPAVACADEGWPTGGGRATGGMAAERDAAADATAAASATAAALDPGTRCVGEGWLPPRPPHARMGRRPLAPIGPPATAPLADAAAGGRAAPHCRHRCLLSKLGENPHSRHRQSCGRPGASTLPPTRDAARCCGLRPPPPPPPCRARCPRPPVSTSWPTRGPPASIPPDPNAWSNCCCCADCCSKARRTLLRSSSRPAPPPPLP